MGEIYFAEKIENSYEVIQNGIYRLLCVADNEFVPPLSSRNSSVQKNLSKKEGKGEPIEYFGDMKKQSAFVLTENGNVTGFISFRKDYTCDAIPKEYLPNIYISTVIADPDYRKHGIAHVLYKRLLQDYTGMNIFTRTWSTNEKHLRILRGMGFVGVESIPNDRGEGINTVYLAKYADTFSS